MLAERWKEKFRFVNRSAQILGALGGGLITYLNFYVYSSTDVGFWIIKDGKLLGVGWIFLFCIFLFYALIPIYVLRSLAITLLLKDLLNYAKLNLLPLHPDKSGGLRPVGNLGLRNQYVLMFLGLNIVLLATVSNKYWRAAYP